MFITRIEFRALDRDNVEIWVTESPIMERAIKEKLRRTIANTSYLQKVVRYEAVELKKIQEDNYEDGKRITADISPT
jgi:hypothetical protein